MNNLRRKVNNLKNEVKTIKKEPSTINISGQKTSDSNRSIDNLVPPKDKSPDDMEIYD